MPFSAHDTMFDVRIQKPVIDLQGATYIYKKKLVIEIGIRV